MEYDKHERRWYFLPRKASKVAFDPKIEEIQGTNLFLVRHQSSNKVWVHELGPLVKERGASAIKFLPIKEPKILVVLRTVEIGKETQSYIGVYKILNFGESYEVLLGDTLFSTNKYEGIEFTEKYSRGGE